MINFVYIISTSKFLMSETVYTITTAVEILRHCINTKKLNFACLVDLKKAFDTIDHSLLLSKLNLKNHFFVLSTQQKTLSKFLAKILIKNFEYLENLFWTNCCFDLNQ